MATVIARAGQAAPQRFELTNGSTAVIGRSSEADIVVASDRASRRHAELVCSQGRVQVTDLQSSNGTQLDGNTITSTTWTPGQILMVGPCEFALEVSVAEQATMVTRPKSTSDDTRINPAKTGAVPDQTQFSKNLFVRHWQGGYSLGRSIFINILVIDVIWVLIAANVVAPLMADLAPDARRIAFSIEFLGMMVLGIWQAVGLYRSLRGANKRGAWLISRIFGWVVCIFLVLGVLALGVTWINGLSQISETEIGTSSDGTPLYQLSVNDNVLLFDGQVVWPIVADFQQTLAQNPDINTVVLRSPGGDVVAGRRVNDILRPLQLTTAVADFCHSACTIMFAAGVRRIAAPQAQIGFHATSVILMDEMMTRLMNAFTLRHDSLNSDYYLEAGFDPEFVRRAVATPSTDLLIPTQQELLNVGVLTELIR
ncbi:membrane protein of unknown function [Candidatus Filomicrobium marinum]|uniref:FHA domain-containing protein n=1 Tax=Candidatus Filomicrobium marinum TaxID=1608628 RepID=A0A0D6JGX3_9HYPH|nr:FHA domain-containing protein [Candidatus Filomicrobium marinum]CFX47338.1 membrane protein of unknown function [Candidatus Filomicrobium marinum]CPR20545.1 membrane protein of unknown function [Candidatus Filomicrobium marinum]